MEKAALNKTGIKDEDFENMIIELSALGEVEDLEDAPAEGIFKVKIGKGFKNNFGSLHKVNEILRPAMNEYPYIVKCIFDENSLDIILTRTSSKEKETLINFKES